MQTIGVIPHTGELAAILLRAPAGLPWLYEAPARAWLRARLCLTGAPWTRADIVAAVLVERARELAGLPVPTGWDRNIVTGWIECPGCGRMLVQLKPHQRYCSARCAMRVKAAEDRLEAPIQTRLRPLRRADRQPERDHPVLLAQMYEARLQGSPEGRAD